MSNRLVAALAAAFVFVTVASPATAFEGGGRKPSEAPLVAFGQHYAGQLNNHASDANYGGTTEVAFWRLPPVSTRDQIVVNWHVLPYTRYSGEFPICMILAQGIDDFSWGTVFSQRDYCDESGPTYSVSRSGTAQTAITVQSTDATATFLEFYAYGNKTNPAEFETFPYDFSVEAPRHYLGMSLSPAKEVAANGSISGSVTSADGSPAPDGLGFSLGATWSGGGVASYTATTAGGKLNFGLALPESAAGKSVTFVASRPADSSYQAVTSPKMTVQVAKAPPPPPSPCALARKHLSAVSRQYARISRNAARARGPNHRRLVRKKRRAKRTLDAARAQEQGTC